MPAPRVLALDVGTSSVRAVVFDETGDVRDEPARRYYSGEYDPDRVLARTREAIEEAGGAAKVDAVGASCFGHSLLALDRHGRPLTPILSWRDTRSADAADRLFRRLDNDAVHARTGCQIHTSYWPAKLAWLADEEPETFRAARRFVSFCDYLYAELLGEEPPASVSIVSGTGLLDLRAQAWDEELLDAVGVTPERLPRLGNDALAENRVVPHRLPLACRQRARFEQDRIRDADLAQIVQEEAVLQLRIVEQVAVDRPCKLECEPRDPLGVATGLVVA